ncbi:MAG: hypothetical protein K2M78_15275 [Lachnospiraceae bacterium]|nr:hypothetical protein [Lachnospiraceae bacterium]
MKAVDIRTVTPDVLVDIRHIYIDENLDDEKRRQEFIRKVGNPYCYRVGNMIVKSSYTEGATLTERFRELVLTV